MSLVVMGKLISELNPNDLSEHLYVRRIQSSLNNLRFACDKLKQYKYVALTWCVC